MSAENEEDLGYQADFMRTGAKCGQRTKGQVQKAMKKDSGAQ